MNTPTPAHLVDAALAEAAIEQADEAAFRVLFAIADAEAQVHVARLMRERAARAAA